MNDEQSVNETQPDKLTAITRAWRLGGPMTAEQRREAKALFIETLSSDPNVSLACDRARISRDTAYQWREKDAKFADAWEDAVERTKDVARSSIYQRGIIGWDEPMVSAGQVVYEYEHLLDKDGKPQFDGKGKPIMRRGAMQVVHKWSDTLAIAYAKANLPEYKDKQQLEVSGPGGGPLQAVEIYKVRIPENGRDTTE